MAAAQGFHMLEVARTARETAEALTLVLSVPAALAERFRAVPGQHLGFRFMLDGEEARRNYSITSLGTPGELAVTVKRVAGGLVSNHIHTAVAAGQAHEVGPPTGRFVVPKGEGARTHVAIVAGSGITPVIGMIEQVLRDEPASRFVLLYGNRSVDAIIFRERLEALKDRHIARLTVLHVLSRDEAADVPLLAGRIDGAKVKALLAATIGTAVADRYYLCGPGTMIKDARDVLLADGVARERIGFEFFKQGPEPTTRRAITPRPVKDAAPAGTEAVIIFDGARKTFRVPPGGHIVDAALAAGISVPYSCKGGMCCTCRAKLVEGRIEMTRNFSLEPWEMAAGFVLACQSVPQTARVVLDFDQM